MPRGARACPECGSDEETGWADGEELDYAGTDIPDAYDPDEWEREAEERSVADRTRWVIVVVMLIAFAAAAILLRL